MPLAPLFNLYEALEVEKTASANDIRMAYRRLALQHHPDKNPDDEGAVARFQKINLAHEILSDDDKRQRYDSSTSSSHPNSQPPPTSHDFDGNYYYETESEDDFGFFPMGGARSGFGFGSGGSFEYFNAGRSFFGMPFMSEEEEEEEELVRKCAKIERLRKEAQRQREEVQARNKAEQDRREAKARLAQEIKNQEARAKVKREENEKLMQEQTWSLHNATTVSEKQKYCLHSEFWAKQQQKRKFKCGECAQKRGPTGFKCPHCSLLACQACIEKLRNLEDNAKRINSEKRKTNVQPAEFETSQSEPLSRKPSPKIPGVFVENEDEDELPTPFTKKYDVPNNPPNNFKTGSNGCINANARTDGGQTEPPEFPSAKSKAKAKRAQKSCTSSTATQVNLPHAKSPQLTQRINKGNEPCLTSKTETKINQAKSPETTQPTNKESETIPTYKSEAKTNGKVHVQEQLPNGSSIMEKLQKEIVCLKARLVDSESQLSNVLEQFTQANAALIAEYQAKLRDTEPKSISELLRSKLKDMEYSAKATKDYAEGVEIKLDQEKEKVSGLEAQAKLHQRQIKDLQSELRRERTKAFTLAAEVKLNKEELAHANTELEHRKADLEDIWSKYEESLHNQYDLPPTPTPVRSPTQKEAASQFPTPLPSPGTSSVYCAESGATRAFIKFSDPKKSITSSNLCEAISNFGGEIPIIIDFYKGVKAVVVFSEAFPLAEAMAASPIAIADGSVKVMEWRDKSRKGHTRRNPMTADRGHARGPGAKAQNI